MTLKDVFPGHNITDIDIRTRHVMVFRLLTYIGQRVEGRRTDSIYLDPYVGEGFDLTPNELQLTVRDMFISMKNVGLFIDVSLKTGRGYQLAVSYGGRRYYPYLRDGLPDEEERRVRFEMGDILEIWDREGVKDANKMESAANNGGANTSAH